MINKFILGRSANFFNKEKSLSKTKVQNIFKELSKKKIGNYVMNENRKADNIGEILLHYSLMVFKFQEEPSFIKNTRHRETKYAFLLILEIRDFIIIFKKHISGLDKELDGYITKVDYEKIQYLFGDKKPQYEKLTVTPIGVTHSSITKRTLESKDLNGQISTYTSRRSVPVTTTVNTENERHILRPGSSSVSKLDNKINFDSIVGWANSVCCEFEKEIVKDQFFDSFARPVDFSTMISLPLIPRTLILDASGIRDLLSRQVVFSINGSVLNSKWISRILNYFHETFVVIEYDGDEFYIVESEDKPGIKVGNIKVNEKSLTLDSEFLKRIKLDFGGANKTSLQSYINSKQLFSLTFDNPEYMYISRKIFQDGGLLSNLDEIISCLTVDDFPTIDSEKGDFNGASQTEFTQNSLFYHYENQFALGSSVVICDDLGDEWADYIEFNRDLKLVRLIHCKNSKRTTSASKFHEVVGQALKNIARVGFTEVALNYKMKSWNKCYSDTSIKRIRSGHGSDEIIQIGMEVMSATEIKREIVIMTPYLSKRDLEEQFGKIQNGDSVRPHIPQLIWLLVSFISSCKDFGIVPVICCSR
jgi:hypothetical protein